MVYVRNTSKTRHISANVSSDCSSDNSNAKHAEVDIPPFKTVNVVLGGECGVGSMEIRTVESRYADKNSSEYVSPREVNLIRAYGGRVSFLLKRLGLFTSFPRDKKCSQTTDQQRSLFPMTLGM